MRQQQRSLLRTALAMSVAAAILTGCSVHRLTKEARKEATAFGARVRIREVKRRPDGKVAVKIDLHKTQAPVPVGFGDMKLGGSKWKNLSYFSTEGYKFGTKHYRAEVEGLFDVPAGAKSLTIRQEVHRTLRRDKVSFNFSDVTAGPPTSFAIPAFPFNKASSKKPLSVQADGARVALIGVIVNQPVEIAWSPMYSDANVKQLDGRPLGSKRFGVMVEATYPRHYVGGEAYLVDDKGRRYSPAACYELPGGCPSSNPELAAYGSTIGRPVRPQCRMYAFQAIDPPPQSFDFRLNGTLPPKPGHSMWLTFDDVPISR